MSGSCPSFFDTIAAAMPAGPAPSTITSTSRSHALSILSIPMLLSLPLRSLVEALRQRRHNSRLEQVPDLIQLDRHAGEASRSPPWFLSGLRKRHICECRAVHPIVTGGSADVTHRLPRPGHLQETTPTA